MYLPIQMIIFWFCVFPAIWIFLSILDVFLETQNIVETHSTES